jgi:hypothetical protein
MNTWYHKKVNTLFCKKVKIYLLSYLSIVGTLCLGTGTFFVYLYWRNTQNPWSINHQVWPGVIILSTLGACSLIFEYYEKQLLSIEEE